MTEQQAMRMALKFIVDIHPAFICEAMHHTKAQRHTSLEPCPHVEAQQQVAEALRQALEQPQEKYIMGTPLLDAMWSQSYIAKPDARQKAQEALDKKAENARELGLDYEPVGLIESLKDAKPCCGQYETCWRSCTPRGKFIGQRDAKREWVGLTDEELDQGLCQTNYAMQTAGAWRDGVEWAMNQLKEKNT